MQPVTAPRGGLLAARRKRQDAREIAGKLDLKLPVLRHETDLVDEVAQRLGSFHARRFGIERFL
ncbi:MAG: hypothetical protein ACLQJR_19190 [Stellaceae bacterium]